jgi:fucose permease
MTAIRARAASNPTEIFHDRRTWLLLIACSFYLCFQIGLSSWLPKYCMNRLRWSYNSSGFVLTLYFLGSLIMRFLSPVAFKRTPVRTFYILSILMSAIVFVMFLLLPAPFAVKIVLVFLTGLLQGSAVPALVIICCDAFPARTASASSLFVLGVSLASFASPAVMGHFIETTGYQAPMFMIAGCLLASTLALIPIKMVTLANVRDKKTQ